MHMRLAKLLKTVGVRAEVLMQPPLSFLE